VAQTDSGRTRARQLSAADVKVPASLTVAQTVSDLEKAKDHSRELVPTDDEAPQVTGYRVVRKLGEGSFGTVWLYEEDGTGIRLAIKFFTRVTGRQRDALQAEVKQLALLHADPGIVQLEDVVLDADPPFYSMRYAEGGSLKERLDGGKALPVREALAIFRGVVQALAYVHAKGIRHCDLKPGNVLLDAVGRPLVADFGQAHLNSDASVALGTFFYMAPEQADLTAAVPDTRWDVYALGALFYEMVTGKRPREDSHVRDELAGTVHLAHRLFRYRECVRAAPEPTEHRRAPGMDGPLAEVIDRCLELDPERRLRDAGAVLDALRRRERRLRQRPVLLFGLLAPLLLLLVMAGCAYLIARDAIQESEKTLVRKVTEDNRVAAELMAAVVDKELQQRRRLLEIRAQNEGLVKALQEFGPRAVGDTPERQKLREWLTKFKQRDDERRNHYFFKWTLADPRGHIIADEPQEKGLWDRGQTWQWRDWFSGGSHKFDQKRERFPPLGQTYLTQPYVRFGHDEKGNLHPLAISISTPVRDPQAPGKVLGLLVGTLHVSALHDWLNQVNEQQAMGLVVLFNHRGHCLLHPDGAAMVKRIPEDANPEPIDPALRHHLCDGPHDSDVLPDYHDPLDGKVYLAGYARLPRSGWVAVVQRERQSALEPIEDLRRWLRWLGLVTLVVVIGLMSCLWGWLIWWLRRQEVRAHG
jgi:serine/threonine protein kinase